MAGFPISRAKDIRILLVAALVALLAFWLGEVRIVKGANFTVDSTGDQGDFDPNDGVCAGF